MYFQFANVLLFLGLGVLFVAGMLALGSLLRPDNPEPLKLTTYECGEPPTGSAWVNFNIRFYTVALIFVIFDVEVAFVFPVALVFRDWVLKGQALFALTEIFLFLAILFVGLVVVLVKGDFEWLKKVQVVREPLAKPASDDVREAA